MASVWNQKIVKSKISTSWFFCFPLKEPWSPKFRLHGSFVFQKEPWSPKITVKSKISTSRLKKEPWSPKITVKSKISTSRLKKEPWSARKNPKLTVKSQVRLINRKIRSTRKQLMRQFKSTCQTKIVAAKSRLVNTLKKVDCFFEKSPHWNYCRCRRLAISHEDFGTFGMQTNQQGTFD